MKIGPHVNPGAWSADLLDLGARQNTETGRTLGYAFLSAWIIQTLNSHSLRLGLLHYFSPPQGAPLSANTAMQYIYRSDDGGHT